MRNALGGVQSVLVLGATSEIAGATARALAARGARRFVLAARDPRRVPPPPGAEQVDAVALDALDFAAHEAFAGDAFARLGDVDLALLAFGVLDGDLVTLLETNFVGAASVLAPIARRMVEQGHGTIVVLSSVAAERARRSNFVYGSSKAGLDAFAQGLADELAPQGIDVMIVRPGFVRGRMTAGRAPAPLSTTPDAVAAAIVDGLARRAPIVWVPGTLRLVMAVVRHVPRPLLRRLPF